MHPLLARMFFSPGCFQGCVFVFAEPRRKWFCVHQQCNSKALFVSSRWLLVAVAVQQWDRCGNVEARMQTCPVCWWQLGLSMRHANAASLALAQFWIEVPSSKPLRHVLHNEDGFCKLCTCVLTNGTGPYQQATWRCWRWQTWALYAPCQWCCLQQQAVHEHSFFSAFSACPVFSSAAIMLSNTFSMHCWQYLGGTQVKRGASHNDTLILKIIVVLILRFNAPEVQALAFCLVLASKLLGGVLQTRALSNARAVKVWNPNGH